MLFSTFLYMWYHGNKPIFAYNYIANDFEDQIPGLFPAGWFSIVNPFNVRVVLDGDNKVMEVKSAGSEDVTEIQKKFKKTTEGIIQCKVKMLDDNGRFVIHMTQLDREYNPYDDIIIAFLEGGIHVVKEENLITLGDGVSWAIDEQSLEESTPLTNYEINIWYLVRIDFTIESFLLAIDGVSLGEFQYPRYNSPYFVSLYFVSFATQYNFKFYVDNVNIRITDAIVYIHPLNIFISIIIFSSLFVILFNCFKYSKLKNKGKLGKNKIIKG